MTRPQLFSLSAIKNSRPQTELNDWPHIDSILKAEMARDARLSALAYANLAVFSAVLFCFSGLSPDTAICYMVTAYLAFFVSYCFARIYQKSEKKKPLGVLLLSSVIINELALASILLFDYFAELRINPFAGVIIIASISFISVPICARFTKPLLFAKLSIISLCCFYIVSTPGLLLPTTEIIALLIVSSLIMSAIGYWIVQRRKEDVRLQLRLSELNEIHEQQNQQLEKALEDTRIAQQRSADEFVLRQKLLSHIGHDLRQPINAAVYMLLELGKGESSDSRSTLISDTNECISSASRMIEDIVQFTHYDNPAIEVLSEIVEINSVLEKIEREYRKPAKAIDCTISHVTTHTHIQFDPELLMRILRNLTSNALKHAQASRIVMGVRHRRGGVEIWLLDNGNGLMRYNEDTLSSSANNKGLGLGIKIANQLAKACGSELVINTKHGKGTRCRLVIPKELMVQR